MKIALKDIRPNPYRNLERYPLVPAIVERLVRSIQATEAGFWDNVLVRKNKAGEYEISAGGHHRVEAAKQAGLTHADFIVKQLSDADMLKVMTLENEADLVRTQTSLLIESVEALVRAIAAGTITVELPDNGTKKGTLRTAPSFVVNDRKQGTSEAATDSVSAQFTPLSVAQFLGKATKNGAGEAVRAVVDALELCELRILKRVEIDNTPAIADLQRRVREGWLIYDERERQKLARQREEDQKVEVARLRKEAEAVLKAAQARDAEARKISDALIEEAAERERLAKRAEREAETQAQEKKAQEAQKAARIRQADEERRERDRQQEFKRKAAELEAKVEARRQREAATKARIEEKRAKPTPPPRIHVEEPAKFSEMEVLQAGEKAQQWAQTMLDRSRAMKQRDTLMLKRIKALIDANQKIWSKLAVKFENA